MPTETAALHVSLVFSQMEADLKMFISIAAHVRYTMRCNVRNIASFPDEFLHVPISLSRKGRLLPLLLPCPLMKTKFMHLQTFSRIQIGKTHQGYCLSSRQSEFVAEFIRFILTAKREVALHCQLLGLLDEWYLKKTNLKLLTYGLHLNMMFSFYPKSDVEALRDKWRKRNLKIKASCETDIFPLPSRWWLE